MLDYGIMKKSTALIAFLCGVCGLSTATPVYLKSGATGANDGTSWNDAFTDVCTAITTAAAGDGVLYVAKGVYTFSQRLTISTDLAIYGGFAGDSMSETPATRDTAANATIFSGDVGGDDYWVHYEPDSGYSITTQNLTGEKIIGADGVNYPPAFTGDYDGYRPAISGTNIKGAINFTSASTAILDGLTFTCFYPTETSSATGFGAVVQLQKASCRVNDCTFIGNNTAYGAVYFRAAATIANSRFLFNWANNRASGFSTHSGNPVVTNCLMLCNSRTGHDSGNVFNGWAGGFRVKKCTIVRCLLAASANFNTSYGGPGNIYAAEGGSFTSFSDCVISNCFTACSNARCLPFFSTGNGTIHVERTIFANNLQRVKPTGGKCYSMFNAHTPGKRFSFDSCTFAGNAIVAPQVAATSGSYVLSIVGNYPERCDATLVNCSFESNSASAAEVSGVTPILCRGVATAAYSGGSSVQACLANCAFLGPASNLYDIVQYGTGHSKNLNIVNCVFTVDGESQPTPIFADVPELVRLYSCSIQNKFLTADGMVYSHLESDKVPLERVYINGAARYALSAAAKTPGIRETCDVATNKVDGTAAGSWNFRPIGGFWQALAPSTVALSGSGFDSKIIGDALGASRTAGSFTRGPVQTLAGDAESGATLVLRRDPFGAGSFSGEAVQAVPKGGAISPVTLSLADSSSTTFAGWYDENGDLFSSSDTLTINPITDDLTILTAKIESPKVHLTFSLDGHGIFRDSGADSITIVTNSLIAFPEVPAFTLDEGWHLVGFTLPDLVPQSDASYTAHIITKAVRVLRVVPQSEAPAVQDGLTWATAYGDFAAAYADAGLYRGEIWLKEGVYVFENHMEMLSNVAIRGGFAGNETSAAEAAPETRQSIISGDVGDNNYWRPNAAGGGVSSTKVWVDGDFQPPSPAENHTYWVATGNNSDDTPNAFVCASGSATNCVFDGVVFTLFQKDTIVATSGMTEGLVFSRCKFLACTTDNSSDENRGVVRLYNSGARFTDCLFDGCCRGVLASGSATSTTYFDNCVFSNAYSGNYGGTIFATGSALADIRHCRFASNCCLIRGFQGAAAVTIKSSVGWSRIEDCVFENNRPWVDCHGTVSIGDGKVEIVKCRFAGNSMKDQKFVAESGNGACLALCGWGGMIVVRDCLFSGNSAADTAANTLSLGTVFGQSTGTAVFINCTMENNAATNNSTSSARAATIVHGGGNLALVNCLIDGSILSGERAHDVYCSASDNTLSLVNCVMRNDANGYKPLTFTGATFQPTIANSVIQGYDPADLPAVGANGFLYDVVSSAPSISKLKEEDGVFARALKGSLYARAGRPVWLVETTPYIYDATANASKPWRSLLNRGSYSATVSGLTLDTPLIPDAFGNERKAKKVTPGPLNASAAETVITLR